MDEVNVMNLFDKIVYHHKEMTNLMDELQKELFGNKIFNFQDKEECVNNSTPAETDPLAKENFRYEFCIIQQERYGDRYGEWRENHFKQIGTTRFNTEDIAVVFLNDTKNSIELDKELYYSICEGIKIYLHDVVTNSYKRFRKDKNGIYYLKK